MNILTLTLGPLATNCYLVWQEGRTDAVIIDPAANSRKITVALQARGLRPVCFLLTHAHFDHIGALKPLYAAAPDARVYVGDQDKDDPCDMAYDLLTYTDTYQDGDTVILELSGNYRHYHCPLARTMILGNASQKVRDLGATVSEGLTAALEGIRPGMLAEDVEEIWRTTIAKSGFVKDSRIGYSMGLNFPPDWGEHTASLRPGDKTVLQPGMTFHMIPGIWLEDCGVDTSEPFVVTETGAEPFCHFRRELLVK